MMNFRYINLKKISIMIYWHNDNSNLLIKLASGVDNCESYSWKPNESCSSPFTLPKGDSKIKKV